MGGGGDAVNVVSAHSMEMNWTGDAHMHVVITGDTFAFPKGLAATRYVRLLARGLHETGSHVHIIVPHYTEFGDTPANTVGRGVLEGISYEYAPGTPVAPIGRLGWRIGKRRARCLIALRLLQLRCQKRLDAVIFYGRSHALLLQCSRWCRLLRVPLIVYIVEWSLAFKKKSSEQLREAAEFYRGVCDHADAVVVISRFLEDKIATLLSRSGRSGLPCLRTSILCDPADWGGVEPMVARRPYVLYCAQLDGYQRDTLSVVDAVSKLRSAGIELILVGPASTETRRRILSELDRLNLRDRTLLKTEYLPTRELFGLYAGASALLAPLGTDDRSLARFPSKIADYLLSGRPVVSCAVGEVAEYLRDGETAFLCAPDCVDAFAAKIWEALSSPDRMAVGLRGKQLAEKTFNYATRARELSEFFSSCVKPGRIAVRSYTH